MTVLSSVIAHAGTIPSNNEVRLNHLEKRASPPPDIYLPCNNDGELTNLTEESKSDFHLASDNETDDLGVTTFRRVIFSGMRQMERAFPDNDWNLFKILARPADDFNDREHDWEEIILYFNLHIRSTWYPVETTKLKRGSWRKISKSSISSAGWKSFDYRDVIRTPAEAIGLIVPFGYTGKFLYMQIAIYENGWPRGRAEITHLFGGFLGPTIKVAVADRDRKVFRIPNPGNGTALGDGCLSD